MAISISMTNHALDREYGRGVSRQEISEVINDPAETAPGGGPGRQKYIGHVREDGRRLVVIATHPPKRNKVVIVTCFYQEPSKE